jgi:prepilin-type N-terminal cleavage/methylation domain-containing protein
MLKWKTRTGFTFIEVLVSMVVMAIGLLGLAGVTVVVIRSNALSRQVVDATNIAGTLMETVRQRAASSGVTLPDCAASVVDANSCPNLAKAGLTGLTNFFPASAGNCGIGDVFEPGATNENFDIVKVSSDPTDLNPGPVGASYNFPTSNVCAVAGPGANARTLAQGEFIRYFRSFQPAGGQASDRTISVVVVWQDRFNRWRHVRLTTRQ